MLEKIGCKKKDDKNLHYLKDRNKIYLMESLPTKSILSTIEIESLSIRLKIVTQS